MAIPKTKTLETPQERLELAKRYLQNAKEILKKAGYDRRTGIYVDVKYVSEASGTAYLAALEALKALFLWERLVDGRSLNLKLKKVDMYDRLLKGVSRIGKDKDVLRVLFNEVYHILHLGGYYRELRNKKAIDAGFESVAKIIKIVERHVKIKS
ncbi:MAG: hypothetical protein GXO39_01385 [Thermotogae bacterium]|nr:hypothetical protein [Thermotogota bacterium]